MHSGKGLYCNMIVMETRKLVISLPQDVNVPEGKRKVSFFAIPGKIVRICGIYGIVSKKHSENPTRFLDWIIPKEDHFHFPQMLLRSTSSVKKVSSANAT